jgi:hypothetical protein
MIHHIHMSELCLEHSIFINHQHSRHQDLITFPRLNGDLATSNFCFWYLTVKVKYADAGVFPF